MFPARQMHFKAAKISLASLAMVLFEEAAQNRSVLNFAHGFLPHIHVAQVFSGEAWNQGLEHFNEIPQLFERDAQTVDARR
jgi:hypothetical protein